MHDFDQEQREQHEQRQQELGDQSFMLRGETFQVKRHVPFGTLAKFAGVTPLTDDEDVFTVVETIITDLLVGGQETRDRFHRVIHNTDTDFPVTYDDLLKIRDWVFAEASGRPPTQPASSSESPSTNGRNETATSSSEPAEASTS